MHIFDDNEWWTIEGIKDGGEEYSKIGFQCLLEWRSDQKSLPKISHLLRAHLYVYEGAYLSNSYCTVVNIGIFLFGINLEIIFFIPTKGKDFIQ